MAASDQIAELGQRRPGPSLPYLRGEGTVPLEQLAPDRRTMSYETLEGWFTDPYELHEARWLSNGKPTKLVRDGHATSYEELPEGPFTRAPEPIESEGTAGPSDLLRADDAESAGTPMDAGGTYMRQMDAVWSDGAPLPWIYDIKGSTD